MAAPQPDADGFKTCPSGPPEIGSVLLGIVTAPGEIAYVTPHPPVTQGLLERLGRNGAPIENRVRFACRCAESGCVQWEGDANAGRCGLIDHALEALAISDGPERLPHCGIRHTCRWFAQQGRNACAACPEVIRKPAR